MTKMEFLNKLQEALSNDLNNTIVQENINYYRQYIEDEVRKGREEEEVLAELGDPWALAKTISDSEEIKKKKSNTYESQRSYTETYSNSEGTQGSSESESKWSRLGSGIKVFIVFLLVIVALVVIISIIGGIFSALVPILIPVVLVMFVVRLFFGRR